MRIKAPLLLTAALCLMAWGGWLAGQGLYINAKAEVAQVLLEQAWAETKAEGHPVKAWSWADTWPVARVRAPRVGGDSIVLAGASGEALAFGPGHMANTPAPGRTGTSVIAAHRDTHFTFLKELQVGDSIEIESPDGQLSHFIVEDLRIVDADASGIDPSAPGTRIALVTCYPFDSNRPGPLRYVVMASSEEDMI